MEYLPTKPKNPSFLLKKRSFDYAPLRMAITKHILSLFSQKGRTGGASFDFILQLFLWWKQRKNVFFCGDGGGSAPRDLPSPHGGHRPRRLPK